MSNFNKDFTQRQIVDLLLDCNGSDWTPDEANIIARYLTTQSKDKTKNYLIY